MDDDDDEDNEECQIDLDELFRDEMGEDDDDDDQIEDDGDNECMRMRLV